MHIFTFYTINISIIFVALRVPYINAKFEVDVDILDKSTKIFLCSA